MNELIKVDYSGEKPAVSARELHEFLEVKTAYKDWFPRMCEYGFTQGEDFNLLKNERVQYEGTRAVTRIIDDAVMTIDMAKEICMLQRNEKGKIARQYFLQLERDWNSPEKVMARALQIADRKIKELEISNSALSTSLEIARPKAEYFDQLVERGTLLSLRESAKELGIPPKKFVDELLARKYLYRSKNGKLLPYEEKNNGLFELKESVNTATGWSGTQTLTTPKGRDLFRQWGM